MKKILSFALLAALVVPVFAQETKPVGLSLRAGLFFPSASVASDEGNTWFIGGLEYKLGDLNFGGVGSRTSSSYSISVDFYNKGDFGSVPVLLNYVGRTEQIYFSAGAGWSSVKRRLTNNTTKTEGEFAYQFSVGYDFVQGATPIFVEARYLGTAESDVNGFGVLVGVRF